MYGSLTVLLPISPTQSVLLLLVAQTLSKALDVAIVHNSVPCSWGMLELGDFFYFVEVVNGALQKVELLPGGFRKTEMGSKGLSYLFEEG